MALAVHNRYRVPVEERVVRDRVGVAPAWPTRIGTNANSATLTLIIGPMAPACHSFNGPAKPSCAPWRQPIAVAAGLHYSSVSKIITAHEAGGNSRFKS